MTNDGKSGKTESEQIDRVERLERRVLALTDRLDLMDLVARYQRLADGGRNGPTHSDPVALAAMFTPDAEFSVHRTKPPLHGREAIQAQFERLKTSVPWIIHYATNPIIDIDGDSASAEIKGVAVYRRDGTEGTARGRYQGRFTRTPEGWRFSSWLFDYADDEDMTRR